MGYLMFKEFEREVNEDDAQIQKLVEWMGYEAQIQKIVK